MKRAVAWYAEHGIQVERVLSDNGSCYRSLAWRLCLSLGITQTQSAPPTQTNGKLERFHRTLADGWAYAAPTARSPNGEPRYPGWLHFYNHHPIHSATSGPPVSRLKTCLGITPRAAQATDDSLLLRRVGNCPPSVENRVVHQHRYNNECATVVHSFGGCQ